MMIPKLTHIDAKGEARMVDVGNKRPTKRFAIAEGQIKMATATLNAIESGDAAKGDVLAAARIAGILAAKQTSSLIPLCHPLLLNKIEINIEALPGLPGYRVRAIVKVDGVTGVEMEALTAASVACLTIYDMAKAIDKFMVISDIRVLEKQGGKSGNWKRQDV